MALLSSTQIENMIRYSGGVTVVHNAVTTYGHHELADRAFEVGSGVVTNARKQFVRVATGKLSSLDIGESITVDGTAYEIADVRVWDEDGAFGDGSITEIELG